MNTYLRIYDLKQCELEEFFSEYNDYDNETKLQTINELLETDSKIRIKLLEKYKRFNSHLLPIEVELFLYSTSEEIKCWTKKGIFKTYIHINDYQEKIILYDRLQIEKMSYADIEGIRYLQEYIKERNKK